ncbi:hypothetical protein TEU_03285 [Thermococcus eurythermalis]|uniref:Tyr recombinase domain-containing protein n=1 Tax=Thermococcus eurythermalis TaxID=1505907 RepID=A0A097QSK7_9EURY|nr:site-specific integrase [Thermococcus eurythermalis]AIU69447.1 hypothetical protein TEU_03285 [Thermococcus eurythermalis]
MQWDKLYTYNTRFEVVDMFVEQSKEVFVIVSDNDFEGWLMYKQKIGTTKDWMRNLRNWTRQFREMMRDEFPHLTIVRSGVYYYQLNRQVIHRFMMYLFNKYSYRSYQKFYHSFFDFLDWVATNIDLTDEEYKNLLVLQSLKNKYSLRKLVNQHQLAEYRDSRTIKAVTTEDIRKSIELIVDLYNNSNKMRLTDWFVWSSSVALTVMSVTGMRFRDLRSIKFRDVDWEARMIIGKNNKIGELDFYFLNDEALELLIKYKELFGLSDSDYIVGYRRLDEAFRRIREQVYSKELIKASRLSNNTIIQILYPVQLKMCKKAYVNRLVEMGVKEPVLSLLTHHRNPSRGLENSQVAKTLWNHYINKVVRADTNLYKMLREEYDKAFKSLKLLPESFYELF